MINHIIGREKEVKSLRNLLNSNRPEFLAIYGRRRVGKTFLIKEFFKKQKVFFFTITGLKKGSMKDQIRHFTTEVSRHFYNEVDITPKKNWDETLELLTQSLKAIDKKIVIFFDELPWMATPKSRLLESIDYYWNQYWSSDSRIKFIVCGSSAAWIIKNIINNKGGLHNRLTYDIFLEPLNLYQTQQFLISRNIKLNQSHIIDLYMVLGGVPHYLDKLEPGLSSTQLIEQLGFTRNSFLAREFDNLFSSLFKNANDYIEIITHIANYRYGVGQAELLKQLGTSFAGKKGHEKLKALEDASFIVSFKPLYHKDKGTYYRLVDQYCLFYLSWIKPIKDTLLKKSLARGYWNQIRKQANWKSWAGLTFEAICFDHLSQIAAALKLSPTSIPSSWRYVPRKEKAEKGAQIDLLFDRDDDAITICEIKYTEKPFVITKDYADRLLQKISTFKTITRCKKQVFVAFIAANGLKHNKHSKELACNVVTLKDLFNKTD